MNTTKRSIRPLTYVCRDEDGVLLKLEMPGVDRDSIEVAVDGDELAIRGHRLEVDQDAKYVVRERPHGDFAHAFTIDSTIDRQRIEAQMDNGILTVHLHLREEEKPRTIPVKQEG